MCAPSWRRNCLGGEAAPEKRKDGTSQQRTPTCSQPQRQAKQALSPIKNRAWWEKAAKWHLISPEDSVWTCLMPLFFWFMNECYPVGIYKKVLSLNCPSTGLCWFYTFSFDYYLIFLVSWTLIDRAYWRKLVEKQHPTLLLCLWINILAIWTILTQWWILWHWEKQLVVDAPKNLKLQNRSRRKELKWWTQSFREKLREYCNKLRTEFSLLIVSC